MAYAGEGVSDESRCSRGRLQACLLELQGVDGFAQHSRLESVAQVGTYRRHRATQRSTRRVDLADCDVRQEERVSTEHVVGSQVGGHLVEQPPCRALHPTRRVRRRDLGGPPGRRAAHVPGCAVARAAA